MTYKGRYRVKNKSKYKGDPSKVVYRSMWEKQVFLWCDGNPDIVEWSSEEVVIPYLYEVDKKVHRYFMDLKIKLKSGKVILVEIKPDKQTKPPLRPNKSARYLNEALTFVKNQNKWKAASEYAKDRGWDFQIWTENTLTEMGILKTLDKRKRRKRTT